MTLKQTGRWSVSLVFVWMMVMVSGILIAAETPASSPELKPEDLMVKARVRQRAMAQIPASRFWAPVTIDMGKDSSELSTRVNAWLAAEKLSSEEIFLWSGTLKSFEKNMGVEEITEVMDGANVSDDLLRELDGIKGIRKTDYHGYAEWKLVSPSKIEYALIFLPKQKRVVLGNTRSAEFFVSQLDANPEATMEKLNQEIPPLKPGILANIEIHIFTVSMNITTTTNKTGELLGQFTGTIQSEDIGNNGNASLNGNFVIGVHGEMTLQGSGADEKKTGTLHFSATREEDGKFHGNADFQFPKGTAKLSMQGISERDPEKIALAVREVSKIAEQLDAMNSETENFTELIESLEGMQKAYATIIPRVNFNGAVAIDVGEMTFSSGWDTGSFFFKEDAKSLLPPPEKPVNVFSSSEDAMKDLKSQSLNIQYSEKEGFEASIKVAFHTPGNAASVGGIALLGINNLRTETANETGVEAEIMKILLAPIRTSPAQEGEVTLETKYTSEELTRLIQLIKKIDLPENNPDNDGNGEKPVAAPRF